MRTVCVCIDGSKNSNYALEFAKNRGIINSKMDKIVLLHARIPPFTGGYGFSPGVMYADLNAYNLADNANKSASHKLLAETATMLKQAGFKVQAFALKGSPENELHYKISKIQPNLVVIGSRGLGPVSRTLMGSVSEFLVHCLKCPVLVVRSPISLS
jgi:nucleotide-binding universal stress UspA family protein